MTHNAGPKLISNWSTLLELNKGEVLFRMDVFGFFDVVAPQWCKRLIMQKDQHFHSSSYPVPTRYMNQRSVFSGLLIIGQLSYYCIFHTVQELVNQKIKISFGLQ